MRCVAAGLSRPHNISQFFPYLFRIQALAVGLVGTEWTGRARSAHQHNLSHYLVLHAACERPDASINTAARRCSICKGLHWRHWPGITSGVLHLQVERSRSIRRTQQSFAILYVRIRHLVLIRLHKVEYPTVHGHDTESRFLFCCLPAIACALLPARAAETSVTDRP